MRFAPIKKHDVMNQGDEKIKRLQKRFTQALKEAGEQIGKAAEEYRAKVRRALIQWQMDSGKLH